jgi:L-iditol 2-dehydrogenase
MQALALEDARVLYIRNLSEPEVGAQNVPIRVKVRNMRGRYSWLRGSTRRRIPPLIMGHQAAGVVTKIQVHHVERLPRQGLTIAEVTFPDKDTSISGLPNSGDRFLPSPR